MQYLKIIYLENMKLFQIQKTNYSIKTNPRMTAYRFILKKSDWEKISKKYVLSKKNLLKQ